MNRRSGASLDRLLGQMAPPQVPPGLAPRILVETTRLPQHQPREAIMAALPPPHRTLGRHAVGQRIAGLAAFAVAACLVMVLLPLGVRQVEPTPVAVQDKAVPPVARSAEKARSGEVATVTGPVSFQPVPPHKAKTFAPAKDVDDGEVLADADPAEPMIREVAETSPAAVPAPSNTPQLAEVEGPKISVQGPPTPIELTPVGSRAKAGLGVVSSPGATTNLPHPR